MRILTDNDIVILLGAGASAEAGVKVTSQMIADLEATLRNDAKNKNFEKLYNFLKQQKTLLNNKEPLNIEELVNIIDELCLLIEKKHPLSLINLSWVNFMEQTGYDTKLLKEFKILVFDKLKQWIPISKITKPKYYNRIAKFQDNYGFCLRIFTLNYDKCVEDYCSHLESDNKNSNETRLLQIERGFGVEKDNDDNTEWNYKNFIEGDSTPQIYLYKMHGSIDWERDENDKTKRENNINLIKNFDIIFGTTQKLKAYDPYLFFTYEFRERTLNSKIVVISGYGFGDEHINKILKQSYENGKNSPHFVINMYDTTNETAIQFICEKLGISNTDRIQIVIAKASDFFEKHLDVENFKTIYYGKDDAVELPF